jgi:ribosomal protein S18 acetylase RimI-like enzyme
MPEFRGLRIAARLLEAIELSLKRDGVDHLRLNVLASNRSARTSYERAGFAPYEVVYEKSPLR